MKDSYLFTILFIILIFVSNIFFVYEHERVHELSCTYFKGEARINFDIFNPYTECKLPVKYYESNVLSASINDSIGYQLLTGIDILLLMVWVVYYMHLLKEERGKRFQ